MAGSLNPVSLEQTGERPEQSPVLSHLGQGDPGAEAPHTKNFLQEISLGTNVGVIQTTWLFRLCVYVSAEHKLFLVEHFQMPSHCNNLKAISGVVKTTLTSSKDSRTFFPYVLTSHSISSTLLKFLKDVLPEILQE